MESRSACSRICFDPLPPLGTHAASLPNISRCSQARAAVQSRCTVAGPTIEYLRDLLNESPAKKRNSTTWLCRGSISASVSAHHRATTSTSTSPGWRPIASSSDTLHTPPASFRGAVAAGIVDKDLAHQLGRDGEEMCAALPRESPD